MHPLHLRAHRKNFAKKFQEEPDQLHSTVAFVASSANARSKVRQRFSRRRVVFPSFDLRFVRLGQNQNRFFVIFLALRLHHIPRGQAGDREWRRLAVKLFSEFTSKEAHYPIGAP